MKTFLQFGFAALFTFIIVVSGLGIWLAVFEIDHYDRVYPGVSVWGAEMGGMRSAGAAESLSRKLSFLQSEEIVFRYGDYVWSATPGQLGLSIDLESAVQTALSYGRAGSYGDDFRDQWRAFYSGFRIAPLIVFDQSKAEEMLAGIASGIDIEPKDAFITVDDYSVTIFPGQTGKEVNVRATADQLVIPLTSFSGIDMQLLVDEQRPILVDGTQQTFIAERILSKPLELIVEAPREHDPKIWIIDRSSLADMLVLRNMAGSENQTLYGVGLDQRRLWEFLEYAAAQLHIPPANPRFAFDETTRELVVMKPAVHGRRLNIEQTLDAINSNLASGKHYVEFDFDDIKPQVADDARAGEMGISEMVSSATTFFRGSDQARLNNIMIGGKTMHGVVVAPGEVFSFNNFLGDVSLDTGFAEAWIIYGGRTIQGVGGGICQVSTTAFRAAFLGGYPTVERNPHAYRVGYYEQGPGSLGPGLDATIFKPLADFRFRNDRQAWLLVNVEFSEDQDSITFIFYSTVDGRKVTVEPAVVSNVVLPDPAQYEESSDLATGVIKQVDWAADGADVSVRRVVELDGEALIDEELITRYLPWQAVYQYGPGTELPQDLSAVGEPEG